MGWRAAVGLLVTLALGPMIAGGAAAGAPDGGHPASEARETGKGALGDAKALYALQRFRQARAAFLRLAEAGDGEAAYRLALMLEAGQGGPADPEAALTWLVKAARLGFEPACRLLMERRGAQAAAESCALGGEHADLLLAAAKEGDVRAMLLLARRAAAGAGGVPDLETAVAWLRKAEAAGDGRVKAYALEALARICGQAAAPPGCRAADEAQEGAAHQSPAGPSRQAAVSAPAVGAGDAER